MISHLINTDVGNRGMLEVYLDYRKSNFDFLQNSARILLDAESVLLVTGFPVPSEGIPETDGPPGTLALYRALSQVGKSPEILTQESVKAAMMSFGKAFPLKFSDGDVSKYDAVVFVETPGRASDGNHYSMSGLKVEGETFDWVADEARLYGIPTIGIGDGGNEIGMGKIRDLIVKYVPHGEKIASVVETDELITSAVSNWGAYGLVAQLSLEKGRNLLKGWEEEFVVRILVRAGLIDGVSKKREVSVDGIPVEIHRGIVGLLESYVDWRLG
ncbi:DUF4392 domain-containing protein [Thermococcus sp.]